MKIIDEKGRLFGKVNLIDLLVILLVLALALAVIWKVVGSKAAEAVKSEPIRVSYTVLCSDVAPELCDFADTQVGEKLLNNAKFLDATITNCESKPAADGLENLYVTVEAAATTSDNIYKVASQEVRVGYEYNIKTQLFELPGVICDLEVSHG